MKTQLNKKTLAAAPRVAMALLLGVASAVWAAEGPSPTDAQHTVDVFKKADPGLEKQLAEAPGYVVIPRVNKGAFIFGGAGGRGVLFEKGVATGEVTLTQVTVGAQIGGQSYSELVFFEDESTLADFKKSNLVFSAQASAVAASAGAAANAKYERGVQIFTIAKGGLMLEASVGGQQFSYHPYAPPKVGLR